MSKKDYILIADILKDAKPKERNYGEVYLWETLVKRFAQQLHAENPHFDWKRFYLACDCPLE